jgi:hypothetical protein
MSALFFGGHVGIDLVRYFGPKEDPSEFFARAEALLIKSQYESRVRFRFAPAKLLKLKTPFAVDIETPRIEKIRLA